MVHKHDLNNFVDLLAVYREAFKGTALLDAWDNFVHDLADLCQKGNPTFNRVKFLRAAGLAKAAEFEAKLRNPLHIPTVQAEEPVRLRLGD